MNNNTNVAKTKVCTLCHVTFPATTDHFVIDRKGKLGLSSRCKECLKKLREPKKGFKHHYDIKRYEVVGQQKRDNAKEWYWNNVGKKSEYDRKYREENKEKRQEQKRRYYLNNKEYCLRKNIENREANKERYLKYRMEYYQRNKEWIKQKVDIWRRNNLDKFNSSMQRRRARKRKVDSSFTAEEWVKCKKYFNDKCAYCGKKEEQLTQEHFIPLSKGGEYTVNNIIPACKSCNCSKQDKDFFFWYPITPNYSVRREKKILKYLGYAEDKQQLALFK